MLKDYLQGFENRLLQPDFRKITFEIEIIYKEDCLFRFQKSGILSVMPSSSLGLDITEVADMSGIYDLQVEFSTGSKSKTQNGSTKYEDKSKTSQRGFSKWFTDVCSSLGNRIYLIPDTNFIRRLYHSNYLREILSSRSDISMMIPRLGIIEIENKYNRNTPNLNKPQDESKIEKYNQAGMTRAKERRIAFQTISEILSIKNNGGGILPITDLSLLQSFVPVSGQGYADAWIRREVAASSNQLVQYKEVKPNEIQQTNTVFLTCDLMNALAAVAEDLNMIYFYRLDEDTIGLGSDPYEVLAKLVINTAVHFGECILLLNGDIKQERNKVVGTWKGKSMDDWYNNFVTMI